ncbi:MAG: lipopolysaccharide biosynthesis protein [Eubacterium sp.]|nr:lipopolysaccharide biosynthesis protein [Eubacterium sp.]
MKIVKRFLTESKNIDRSSAFWNMFGSMLLSFQSVILLIVMAHTVGPVAAGIYTIGNTSNNLFLNIGKYGSRSFQVSDVSREYVFKEYHRSRIITCIAMGLISIAYVLWSANRNSYSSEKTAIVIWMCLFKIPDAYEDIFQAEYQKNDRLDVAAKCLSLRMIITIILWAILLFITRNLLVSTIISTIVTYILCGLFIVLTKEFISEKKDYSMKKVWKLLLVMAPLCLGGFMTTYIGAAPRYSIDRYMDDVTQGIYGYIVMPVFVVQLLVTFIFNPVLHKVSLMWDEGRYKDYLKTTFVQSGLVVGLTLVCMTGAWLLGVPVLSVFYNTDLSPYKFDLMVVMLGSGFLGFTGLFGQLLTVMRCQNVMLIGYGITSVIAFLLSDKAVLTYGIRGACVFYTILLFILMMVFVLLYTIRILRAWKKTDLKGSDGKEA